MTQYIKSIHKYVLHINAISSVGFSRVVTEIEYYNIDGTTTICEYTGIIDGCPMYANNFENFTNKLFNLFGCQITYTPVEEAELPKTRKYDVKITFENGEEWVFDNPIETLDRFMACDLFALRHKMLPIMSDEYSTVKKALNHIAGDIITFMIKNHQIPSGMTCGFTLKKIELIEIVDKKEED